MSSSFFKGGRLVRGHEIARFLLVAWLAAAFGSKSLFAADPEAMDCGKNASMLVDAKNHPVLEHEPDPWAVWERWGLPMEGGFKRYTTDRLGIIHLVGADGLYGRTVARHLRGQTKVTRSHAIRALLVADQVVLNALVKDRTDVLRELEKTPSDKKLEARLAESNKKIRLYAATTLSRLAEVVYAREPLESQDKNQLCGVYLTAVESFLIGSGDKYDRIKRSGEAAIIQILPSDTLLGKLAASEEKRGHRLMASRPDIFHADANSLFHNIFDSEQRITGLSITELLYPEKDTLQHLRSTVGKAIQMDNHGGPAGSLYVLGKRVIDGVNLKMAQNWAENYRKFWQKTDQLNQERMAEEVSFELPIVRAMQKAAARAVEGLAQAHSQASAGYLLGSYGFDIVKEPSGRIGLRIPTTSGPVVFTIDGAGQWGIAIGNDLKVQVTPRSPRLEEITTQARTMFERMATNKSELDPLLVIEMAAALKRHQEVSLGLATETAGNLAELHQKLTAPAPMASTEYFEQLKEPLQKIADLEVSHRTLGAIDVERTSNAPPAGGGRKAAQPATFRIKNPRFQNYIGGDSATTQTIEHASITAISLWASLKGWKWKDVSADKVGFDLILEDPKTGETWYVEAKGHLKNPDKPTFFNIYNTEIVAALKHPEHAVLAVTEFDKGGNVELSFFRDFIRYPPNPGEESARVRLDRLERAATRIGM